MNLKYMKVLLFEISYGKKKDFILFFFLDVPVLPSKGRGFFKGVGQCFSTLLLGTPTLHCTYVSLFWHAFQVLEFLLMSSWVKAGVFGLGDTKSAVLNPGPELRNWCRALLSHKLLEDNVTLEHKTSLKSLGYICSNSQQYTVWVIICLFCQKSLGYYVKIMFHKDLVNFLL